MEHNKQKGDEISFTNKAEKLNFGKTGLDILDVYLPLSNLTKTPLNPSLLSPHQIQEIGLEIRNEVEWTAWSDKTAFPPLKQNAAVGIALGQCLVTSRFAADFFLVSRIAEVKVKRNDGAIVGSHIVLVLQTNEGVHALDLTPDQSLARGDVPFETKGANWRFKVAISSLGDPNCPYIIENYQSDQELAIRKSKPLDHTRLLKEMMAFIKLNPIINGLERYAHESDSRVLLKTDNSKVKRLVKLLSEHDGNGLNLNVGLITDTPFSPRPSWLWEASGLTGHKLAYVIDNGFIKEGFLYHENQIHIFDLHPYSKDKNLLLEANRIMRTKSTTPLISRPPVWTYLKRRGITGPIFVDST